MKLVIREYLSMLKESEELDALLPDLLLAMGITPLSRPCKGTRQDGVDIAAVGIDPEDGVEKLFLLTVKRGHITRKDWTEAPNGVRASLDEIIEGYLRTRILPEHETLHKNIVLATGGELKQNVEKNWTDFVHAHTKSHPKYGQIKFVFWGGDKLTSLIEKYLLDEYLFPESAQKYLRKTTALADQNEEEPRYFYRLIEETLFNDSLPNDKKKSSQSKRQRTLCLLNLSLNIVFHWCQESDNLQPALLCVEHLVLRTWDWMRQCELFDCETTVKGFSRLFLSYLQITDAYAFKLQPHCLVKDGLFGYGAADELEYPLRTFEVIGILGLLGLAHWHLAQAYQDEQVCESHFERTRALAQMIAGLIQNNPSALTPLYDNHAIDIALGLLTLTAAGYEQQAAAWVKDLSMHISYAYQLGKHFPIASDSYDQLVAMHFGQAPPKEKLMELSTLLPMLGDWYAILNLSDEYGNYQEFVTKVFTHTNLQLWFPDEETDTYLYERNAGYASGLTVDSIRLPKTLDELKTHIIRLREKQQAFQKLSCFMQHCPILGLIASRHFRTPMIPAYWQYDVPEHKC